MRITLLILAGFLAITAGGLFLVFRKASENVERQYSQASEEPLVDFAHLFASLIEVDVKSGAIDSSRFREAFSKAYQRKFLAKIYQLEKTKIQTHVYVTDKDGIVVFDSENGQREGQDYSQYNDVYLARNGKYGARASRADQDDSRTTIFFIAAPIHDAQGNVIGTLTVSRPETAMAPFAEESRAQLFQWISLAGAVVALLGAFWVYWLLSPIQNLTEHARRIARGETSALPSTGHVELKTLSRALENMRQELEGKHYVENYVQALTHELKSPLAAIRGAAELVHDDREMSVENRDRFLSNILAETVRSEDTVRRLVQLASLESQNFLAKKESVDLRDLLSHELKNCSSAIETKQLTIEADGLDTGQVSPIDGDPFMIRIAIRNLLNNAIDFSPIGTTVSVRYSEDKSGRPMISITDEGPGIPDYAQDRIFDRFYSLKNQETGRKGSGIGLCFVKETMDLHGGSVTIQNRKGATGTEAVLKF